MIHRTWPYGTRKRVQIESIHSIRGARVCIVTHLDEPESTIITLAEGMFAEITPVPKEREEREIEFREGGPLGGYWTICNTELFQGATT